MSEQQLIITELNGANVDVNNGTLNMIYNNQQRESTIRKFLNLLLDSEYIKDEPFEKQLPFDIDAKIDQNKVSDQWLEIINDEYFNYEDAISNILSNDNENGIPKRSIFLSTIGDYYREVKIKLNLYSKPIETIALKSTEILDETLNMYVDFLVKNNEHTNDSDKFLLKILVVYGFMECKVLEKPKMER